MTNILLTCAGRRTSLLQALKKAAHQRGGEVWAGDMSSLAPAVLLADHSTRLPAATADDFTSALCQIIEEHRIRLLVPTIDTELLVLAQDAPRFSALGCEPLVSRADFVRVTGDKWLFHQAMTDLGVRTPRSWTPDTLDPAHMPDQLFLKPRRGSASQGVRALTKDELAAGFENDDDPIIQERVDSPEVTIDALFGLDGTPIHFVPRRRIRTLAGESIQGVTLPYEHFRAWAEPVLDACRQMGARGPITLQAFDTPDGLVLFEINPRFGGGFPLANAAGGTYAEWCVAMAEGETVEPRIGAYQEGLYMTRYNTEIFTCDLPW